MVWGKRIIVPQTGLADGIVSELYDDYKNYIEKIT